MRVSQNTKGISMSGVLVTASHTVSNNKSLLLPPINTYSSSHTVSNNISLLLPPINTYSQRKTPFHITNQFTLKRESVVVSVQHRTRIVGRLTSTFTLLCRTYTCEIWYHNFYSLDRDGTYKTLQLSLIHIQMCIRDRSCWISK